MAPSLHPHRKENFLKLKNTYLVVYVFASYADWLQCPYAYALYRQHRMTERKINALFALGFGSSLVFGTFAASVADKFGRRRCCLLYALLYAGSCVAVHFPNFSMLCAGRLLGGVATSILCSAFESWLVCEHRKRGFDDDAIATIFSQATLLNTLAAVLAGQTTQALADSFGNAAPFDASIVALLAMGVVLLVSWNENYGDATVGVRELFSNAVNALKDDRKIALLGAVQSLFEGAMYTFVLKWTPALRNRADDETICDSSPLGLMFSSFMVSIMCGSLLFACLRRAFAVESLMRAVFLTSAVALFVPVLFPREQFANFAAFCVFEVTVGMFWPCAGVMRERYVPEAVRSTVMNLFRVPLNLIVVAVLLQDFDLETHFGCCSLFLTCASVLQHVLYVSISSESDKKAKSSLAE